MNSITIHAVANDFSHARHYIEKELSDRKISKQISLESILVFEAVFNNILGQVSPDTSINVSVKNSYGQVRICFDYVGSMYIPDSIDDDDMSPEESIIRAYEDKLNFRYHASHNFLSLSVKRGPGKIFTFSIIGMILALILALILRNITSSEQQMYLISQFFFPVESAYSDLILMIGAPITFFTLLSNLTDIYVFSEESSLARVLQNKAFITSVISIFIAIVFFWAISPLTASHYGILTKYASTSFIDLSFKDFIKEHIPSNFFDAFLSSSPMPLILVSIFVVYAFCASGRYLNSFKGFIEAALTVFSKMINPLMFIIPFFCFLAMLEMILERGFSSLSTFIIAFATILLGMVLMLAFYVVRLLIAKVDIADFVKKLIPSLKENFVINSTMDAVSYNIRYCSRTYGINRKLLNQSLPILSKINLDGNCFIIMFNALLLAHITGLTLTPAHMLIIAFVVFFLSIGAPNPPGSIFVVTLIITNLLNLPDMISLCVFSEVLIGPVQNMINAIGDIVTVVILDKELKTKGVEY